MNRELLEKHLRLVIEANKVTNITRITSWDDAWRLHVEDSLLGLNALNQCPDGKYADLGSGAGYPGIPLAIETKRDTTLVDSVGKKTSILDGFIRDLGLSNVRSYHGRIEQLSLEEPGCFAAVSARALAKTPVLLELASPLLQRGGVLICYKALVDQSEFEHARSIEKKVGMSLCSDETYELQGYTRRILCFEKTASSSITLPRHVGFAQKRPL